MPPTTRSARLVFRQLRLTFVSLTTVVVLCILAGLLMGSGFMLLFFLGNLGAVIALFAGILLWTRGEDVDDQPLWIIGYSLAVFALVGPILFGLPKVYLDNVGEPTAAVVTEDVDEVSEPGSEQRIEVRRAGDGGEALGRLKVRADRDLRVGDQVTVLVDPVGWLEPDSGQVPAFRVRVFAYSLGFGGLGLVVLLTVGRAVRDLRLRRRAMAAGAAVAGRESPGRGGTSGNTVKPATGASGKDEAAGTPPRGRPATGASGKGEAAGMPPRGGPATGASGRGKSARRKPADARAARHRATGGKAPKRNPPAQPSRREPRPPDPDKVTDVLESADPGTWSGDSDGGGGGGGGD